MSEAVVVIRRSEGDDDAVGLQQQRERVPEMAADLVGGEENVHVIDLGIHTGFSIHVRDPKDERIDDNQQVLEMIDDLRAGRYDYVCAWDDTRLARDEFFSEIKRAVRLGDAEFAFIEEVQDVDSLTFGVTRRVEQDVKEREIRKSKQARRRRREQGGYEGPPPLGTKWDDDRFSIEPDDQFDDVLEVLEMKDNGATHRQVVDAVDAINSTGTVTNVLERRELYEDLQG